MKTMQSASYSDLILTESYYPSISIIVSVDIQVNPQKEITGHLKVMVHKTSAELLKTYPKSIANPMIKKLKNIITEVDYTKFTNSLAIFVSPLLEKFYYLDMPLEDRIVIDDSFEIRDLVYAKKEIHKYILMIMSSKEGNFYLGNTKSILKLFRIKALEIDGLYHDLPEKVANFTDESKVKENQLDKFLHHIDLQLKQILLQYNIPVFFMGTPKIIGHFKQVSHHKKYISEYIQGNYEELTEAQLLNMIEPHITKWNKQKKEDLIKVIDDALGNRTLAVGIKEVWRRATEKKGKHLIIEKNYVYPARQSSKKEIIFDYDDIVHNDLYIKDAVDDVIEKTLATGGIVEFVDEDVLKDFQKIVLIQYY
jgi:hypothetical protein